MLEIYQERSEETTNNLFILFASQVGSTADGESNFSEIVYQGFMNQLNERQGDVKFIDHQVLKNLDARLSVRQDTKD